MGYESFLGVNPWDAFFTLANTLTIFFVARKFLFNPVMKMISDRQKEIDDIYEAANSANANAKQLEAEYTKKLSEAQETGDRIVKEAVLRGQTREEEIVKKANETAEQMIAKAENSIALEKKKALNDAKDEISDIAMAIAGKVVDREINQADHEKIVDEFIQKLGE